MSFYVSTANYFFLLHCDEWDRVVALPRHKFVTGATLLQLVPGNTIFYKNFNIILIYYIDRHELWGFIHEINSGISHVRYHFFPAGTTFTQL